MQSEPTSAFSQQTHQQNQQDLDLSTYDFSDCKRIKKLTTHEYMHTYLVSIASSTTTFR